MPSRTPLTRRRHGVARIVAVTTAAGLSASALAAPVQAGAAAGAAGDRYRNSTAVIDWNAAAGEAAVAACIAPLNNPLTESRMYAMTHLAVHDAVNAIERRSHSYAATFRAPGYASVDAAVAAAARDVMVAVFGNFPEPFGQACGDQGLASVNRSYTKALNAIHDGRAKTAGIEAGRRAARAVLSRRADDGSDTPLIVTDFPQSTKPGVWRFTPDLPFAFAPEWGTVTPFGLRSAGQFRSAPPPALTSAAYARGLYEVKRLGSDGISAPTDRTPAQTEIARFWWESSPLSWNRIARTLATSADLDPWRQARLFGLLNAALADGYISSFAQKYEMLSWRPVTAIRLADTDGNPATKPDRDWTPLEVTPPIPDQDSAHAVEGGAASMVFRQFFGGDRFRFAQCSNTLPSRTCDSADPKLHHFTSFSQAAWENARSRVYIGFHFRWATVQGQRHGEDIGRYIARTLLPRVDG